MSVLQAVSWATVQSALYQWLASSTGLMVTWANQDAPRPAYPYATLHIPELVRHGPQWELREYDAVNDNVTVQTFADMRFTLTSQIHVLPEQSNDVTMNALALMTSAMAQLRSPAQQELWVAANLSIGVEGTAQDASVEFNDTMINRVVLDTEFHVASCITSTVDYVQTVQGDVTADETVGTFTEPFTSTLP